MRNNCIPIALKHVDEKKRVWRPYGVTFESPEGKFSVYIHAISFDHAYLQLEALKENGRIDGEIHDVIDAA